MDCQETLKRWCRSSWCFALDVNDRPFLLWFLVRSAFFHHNDDMTTFLAGKTGSRSLYLGFVDMVLLRAIFTNGQHHLSPRLVKPFARLGAPVLARRRLPCFLIKCYPVSVKLFLQHISKLSRLDQSEPYVKTGSVFITKRTLQQLENSTSIVDLFQ